MNETEDQSRFQGQEYEEDMEKINALNLSWTLGMNYEIFNGAHNLSTEHRKEIFYATGHTGVIYDFENNTQRLLQGHCNKITCTAVCALEDVIITADAGDDSMLVVWDAKTGIPRKTIFDPHPHGVQCLDITVDGNYIVSISHEAPGERQEVTVWDWKSQNKSRLISHPVHEKAKDEIKYVIFNPDRPQEFATTGERRVLFWTWQSGAQGYEFYGPSYTDKKGKFTQTVFIPNSSQAVTGTTEGHIIVWDISLIMEDYSQPEERRKIKVVNLMNTSNKTETQSKKPVPEINILKIQGNYLVVGASNGAVRFYDFQYTIVSWFEDVGVSNIKSISFSREHRYAFDKGDDDVDKVFDCPDFIVVDSECTVHLLRASQFDEIESKDKQPMPLMKLIKHEVTGISVRPNSCTIAISTRKGPLYHWDYYEKKPNLEEFKTFEEKHDPRCLEHSPDGKYLAVAVQNQINFYDYEKGQWQNISQSLYISLTIQDHTPEVTMMAFAPDSQHLAVADDQYFVSLFKIDYKFGNTDQPKEWQFKLKNKAHLGKIRSLAFGESLAENGEKRLRLFSIADDRQLVEYNIYASQGTGDHERLAVANIFKIEQETLPCACIWYPVDQFKEDILLTINEEYKIKLWNANNVDNKITKKTCLGPTYGDPIRKLRTVRGSEGVDSYLAYSTGNKIVGLIKLPIDGNPNNTMGLIAHPGIITGMTVTSDGKYMFTAGGDDYCVNMWQIDLSVIDQNALLQNNEEIFPDLLEGGRDGQTYRDLKDFFYYSQIRSKKESTTKARKLEGTVPLDEIPNLMRALNRQGYYPTKKEIENMENEIKFSEFLSEGRQLEECNLKTFVALFVNHRPVYGIGKKNIEDALNILTDKKDMVKGELTNGMQDAFRVIFVEEFINLLKTRGETMTEEEIQECLQLLIGEETLDNFEAINSDVLAKDILGFEELNEEVEPSDNVENNQ